MTTRTDTYGPGGFDPAKPNNNIVRTAVADETAGTLTVTDNGKPPVVTPLSADQIRVLTDGTNQTAIETNLRTDMAAMQAVIDTPNATLNTSPAAALKDIARNLKRLDRTALKDYTGTT
jgi:hypothetical protein